MIKTSGQRARAIAGAWGMALVQSTLQTAMAQTPGARWPPPPASPPSVQPAPAPGAALRPPPAVNCGTFWTGWYPPIDPKTNPCPAGCEPAEKVQEKRHQQGTETWIDAQYRCTGVSGRRAAGLEGATVRDARPPSQVVGMLVPAAGPWHSRVIVKGPGFGKAEQTRVIWYPNDDDAQPPAGSTNATLRQRLGSDDIEIEMPNGAGGAMGAVVRVLVFMPQQLQPLLAGRFRVQAGKAGVSDVAQRQASPSTPFVPLTVTTRPMQMTGLRGPDLVPMTVTTRPMQMTGLRGPDFMPMTVTTPAMRMTGVRPPAPAASAPAASAPTGF